LEDSRKTSRFLPTAPVITGRASVMPPRDRCSAG
jgi:hypothetical protein